MSEPAPNQMEFDFAGASSGEAGYNQWQDQRRQALRKLAGQMGLPLGHAVEIWLRGEIRLRGKLLLREEKLFLQEERDFRLELVVDGVPFTAAEIESCVRMD